MPRSLTGNLDFSYSDRTSSGDQPTYKELNWVLLYGRLPLMVDESKIKTLANGVSVSFEIPAQEILLLITPDLDYLKQFVPGSISHDQFIFVASMRISVRCNVTVVDAFFDLSSSDTFPQIEVMTGRKNRITTQLSLVPEIQIDLEDSLDPLSLPLFAEAVEAVQSAVISCAKKILQRTEVKAYQDTDYIPVRRGIVSYPLISDIETVLTRLNVSVSRKSKSYLPVRAVFKLDGDQPISWHSARVQRLPESIDEEVIS